MSLRSLSGELSYQLPACEARRRRVDIDESSFCGEIERVDCGFGTEEEVVVREDERVERSGGGERGLVS